jgi:hypothetical protein
MRSVLVLCVSALCAAVLCLVALPAAATATSTQSEVDAAIAKAVEYVRGQQDPATGEPFGYEHGSFSSDWVATSLGAAGVSAADVRDIASGSPSLQDFLFEDYGSEFWTGGGAETFTTVANYERAALVAHAAGIDPARIGPGANLPAQIAERWNPVAPSFGEPGTTNTAFGILALKVAAVPAWALSPVVSYLRQSQHDDGGWTYSAATTTLAKEEPSEPDMTGAAIAALCEAGAPPYDPSVAPALAYLQGLLVDSSGAIHYAFGDNADATAWAVSGLTACGVDPQSPAWTTPSGKTPIDHLLSLQVPSGPEAGGFGYQDTSEANLYSTQDALRAIAGGVFTAEPPARVDPSQPSVRAVPTVPAGTPVPHLLAIGQSPGNVRMCKVTAAAGAPLTQVLTAAKSSSRPANCVTSFSLSGGVIASLNGVAPANQDEAWLLRLDRGVEVPAGEQPVGFGDLITLRLGEPRGGASAGPEGPAGIAGTTGLPGPRGRHGVRGRPGRNARIGCRAHRGRSGGRRIRCTVGAGHGGAHRRASARLLSIP